LLWRAPTRWTDFRRTRGVHSERQLTELLGNVGRLTGREPWGTCVTSGIERGCRIIGAHGIIGSPGVLAPEELIPADYPERSARLAKTGSPRRRTNELHGDIQHRVTAKSLRKRQSLPTAAIRSAAPRSGPAGWLSRLDRNRKRSPRRPRPRTRPRLPAPRPERASA